MARWVGKIITTLLLALFCHALFSLPAFSDNSNDTKALQYTYSIFDPDLLAPDAQGRYAGRTTEDGRPAFDATLQIMWLVENWDTLSGDVKDEISPFVNPDNLDTGGTGRVLSRSASLEGETIYETTHFAIKYSTTSASNAVSAVDADESGVPDYVEMTGNVLEQVYLKEITYGGFPAPPFVAGKEKLQVALLDMLGCGYVEELNYSCLSVYGMAIPTETNYPRPSILYLDRDFVIEGSEYSPEELMQVTAAHEFFHMIQFGRENGPPIENNLWYFEGTAVWAEQMAYPGINDYLQYFSLSDCNNILWCPEEGLFYEDDTYYLRPYSMALFFQYLSYYQSGMAVKLIQDEAALTFDGERAVTRYVTYTLGDSMKDILFDYAASTIDMKNYPDGEELKDAQWKLEWTQLFPDGILFPPIPTWDESETHPPYSFSINRYRVEWLDRFFGFSDVDGKDTIVVECETERSGCTKYDLSKYFYRESEDDPSIFYVISGNGGDESITVRDKHPTFELISGNNAVTPSDYVAGEWNLVHVALEPFSDIPAYFLNEDSASIFLMKDPYTYVADLNSAQYNISRGSVFWAYVPDNGLLKIFGQGSDENSVAFTVKAGEWTGVGSANVDSNVAFSDSKVSVTLNGTTYTLSDALANKLITPLYYYNPTLGEYEAINLGDDMKPLAGYLMKSTIDGTITFYK